MSSTTFGLCLVVMCHLIHITFTLKFMDTNQEPVHILYRRTVPWDGFPVEALTFDAFGHQYDVPISHVNRRHVDDVPVYVGTSGNFVAESVQSEPIEVYQNADSYLAVSKRQDEEGKWHAEVDGWHRDGDDEVFLTAEPWMNIDYNAGVPHIASRVSKRNDMEEDYVYAASSVDDYVRSQRSQGDIDVVVDLLVLVDHAVYREAISQYLTHRDTMKALKKYYAILVALVDMRYASIDDPTLQIRVRLAELLVAKDSASSPWSDYHITVAQDNPAEMVLDARTGLNQLKEWLESERDGTLRRIKYDHAMAFTGYRLTSKKGSNVNGMAYIATICQIDVGYSCSILEETGGFMKVGTAVHELGHSLGARHDGSGDTCTVTDNFVMAPYSSANPDVLGNYFRFSDCSLESFRETLSSDKASCLMDSGPPGAPKGQLPGRSYTPDEQCQEVFGPNSGKCQSVGIQEPEEICLRLWCTKPTDPRVCVTSSGLSAIYGTTCGDNKICNLGECVDVGSSKKVKQHKQPPNKSNDRFNEVEKQQPRYHSPCREDKDRHYCHQLVTSWPEYCRRTDMLEYCCFSCYYNSEYGQGSQ